MSPALALEAAEIFAAVVVLQLPGKSNFGVITLATRHPRRTVFVGASLGLAAATGVSVAIGLAAATFLSAYTREILIVGGSALIAFGLLELWRAPSAPDEPGTGTLSPGGRSVRTLLLAFALPFALEMGDNTQVLAILFVASTHAPLLVYVAATLGLVAVTAVSCQAADQLRRRIPEERLRVLLAGVLLAVGALTILFALVPASLAGL